MRPQQQLSVPRVQDAKRRAIVVVWLAPRQPRPLAAHHLDALDLTQPNQSVPADHKGKGYRRRRDRTKAPVGLFDKVLQVGAIQASNECAHCQSQRPDAEFELQKHESVSIGIENGSRTVIQIDGQNKQQKDLRVK